MLAGIVGLLGYGFIVATMIHNGNLKLPFTSSPKQAAVIAPASAAPSCSFSTKAWTCDFSKFPNGSLSRQDWNYETSQKFIDYNGEQQAYTPRTSNVRVQNGALTIEARPESFDGKSYTSARINTKGKFEFTYGTLEADIMLPKGSAVWPAAWLFPAHDKYSPADYDIAPNDPMRWSLNGEIDFMEAIGRFPNQNLPHLHNYTEENTLPPSLYPYYVDNPYEEYHRYGVIKTPDKITFTLDGVPYFSQEKSSDSPLDWPYDQPYYLIFDVAVGGDWLELPSIDSSSAPWQMKVRSISYQPQTKQE